LFDEVVVVEVVGVGVGTEIKAELLFFV